MTIQNIIESIKTEKTRSAWDRGVMAYAMDLLEELKDNARHGYFDEENLYSPAMLNDAMLNGARTWCQYSYGGCSLIYNSDIAERVCCPSELKRTHYGERNPNSREDWLDVQARALYQAAAMIKRHARQLAKQEIPA